MNHMEELYMNYTSTAKGLMSYNTVMDLTWYETLVKPALNPPDWIFSPVWTLLYILMGIAVFLVWGRSRHRKNVTVALFLFAVQLLLNAAWSIIFFGLH